VGEQLFISDGDDSRAASDPMNHAIFVIDVTGPGPVAPTASFGATPTTGTVPLDVSFTDTSSGGPATWAWTFGDGGTSTAPSPTHTYTSPGTFTATLTVTNAQGSSSATRNITVTEAPTGVTLDADTYVNTGSPTKNYGAVAWLKLHGVDADYRPLVRFTLGGLSGPPSSVRLRLHVEDGSGSGGNWYLITNAWSESTVVWNNAPTVSGTPVATVGAVTAGTWVEIDLTSAVTGNGTYSFMATSPSTNTAQFTSREGIDVPQILVVP
jgi:PKD repeat protein